MILSFIMATINIALILTMTVYCFQLIGLQNTYTKTEKPDTFPKKISTYNNFGLPILSGFMFILVMIFSNLFKHQHTAIMLIMPLLLSCGFLAVLYQSKELDKLILQILNQNNENKEPKFVCHICPLGDKEQHYCNHFHKPFSQTKCPVKDGDAEAIIPER